MFKKLFLLIGCLFLVIAVFYCNSLAQKDNSGAAVQKEYVIVPNDILEITVYQEQDLSAALRVSQDGSINCPLLGNVEAAGLTVRELEKKLADLLSQDYLVNPQVTVFVKEFGSKSTPLSVFISGQVKNPGAREIKEDTTLTQAVILAGGFTEAANTSKVKIIRTTDGEKETIEVDCDQILEKAAPDIGIRQDDTIIVEEYGRFTIMGQVARPGVYSLKRGLTVLEAINLAGSFTPTASQNGTRVIREEDGKKITIRVPIASITQRGDSSGDIQLKPGDTIVVPESFF